MVSLLTSSSINHTWLPNASTQVLFFTLALEYHLLYGKFLHSYTLKFETMHQLGLYRYGQFRRNIPFIVRSENVPSTSASSCEDRPGRRQLLAMGTTLAPWLSFSQQTPTSFAAETKKGFLSVTDKKDGYTFVYPFGWQEVVVEGQDKVFKDVIEPLESVSVNMIPTGKQDIRDFGPPQEVAETLIKKVLASPSQKTKLIEATEHDVDGKAYYTIEFIAQAPNYTRHALSAVCIGNGFQCMDFKSAYLRSLIWIYKEFVKILHIDNGANERRWEKMKDRLKTVVDFVPDFQRLMIRAIFSERPEFLLSYDVHMLLYYDLFKDT
ncbi:PsbP-like protein 1, chloroplastic [Sesamum angolense]|uniref:PsbP-like protein 1, chloroplastic n=1 Tax=Sesamum angolense TaxID=2727404 RepID=A0AAE1WLY2_9LAMI|nr:PsbP-like protein 1, chloroplastic [Sesamum angolense]